MAYIFLPHHRSSCLDYFYLHSPNFIWSLTPFSLYIVHLITEFGQDLYNFCSPRSQVRALHFYSFTVWLASILVGPRVNKTKPKEDHQINFPLWCHFSFCFRFHTYLVFVWFSVLFWLPSYMGNPTGFHPSPSNDVSLHFNLEPLPSVATQFYH